MNHTDTNAPLTPLTALGATALAAAMAMGALPPMGEAARYSHAPEPQPARPRFKPMTAQDIARLRAAEAKRERRKARRRAGK